MKVFATRRIRSTATTDPATLIHASTKPTDLEFHVVRRTYHRPTRTRKTEEPRITLVIVSRYSDEKYDYAALEMRFTYQEAAALERILAQELNTRHVRSHAQRARPLTRTQARKRLI